MTLKALHGNFLTGATSFNNELPLNGSGNSFVKDINAQERLTLSVSKMKLGMADWSTILSEASTLIILADDSKAWDDEDAILGGGMLNKINSRVGDSIILQVMGLREYLAALICNPSLNGTYSNPNSGVVFAGTTWRGVFAAVVNYVKTIPRTPAILGAIDGIAEVTEPDGNVKARPVLFGDGIRFADLLDSLRDNESVGGNEYLFPLRWTSAAMDKVEFKTKIGSDTNPQINFENTLTIPLAKISDFKSIEFSLAISTEQMANRVLAQSIQGDFELGTGSDLTSFSIDNGKPLLDVWYNVGQELASVEELGTHATARLNDLKEPKGSADYSVIGEPGEWARHMGKRINFVGEVGTEAEGYNISLRMTGLSFELGSKIMKIQLMLPAARYPRLASDTSRRKADSYDATAFPIGSLGIGGVGTPQNTKPGKYVPISGVVKPPVAPPNEKAPIYAPGIFSSMYHTLAILEWDTVESGGVLYSWGSQNSYGQLGHANTNPALLPTPVATDFTDWIWCAAGTAESAGIRKAGGSKTRGTLWFWGLDKTGLATTFPNQVGTDEDWVGAAWAETVPFGDNSSGGMLALKADGTLWKIYSPTHIEPHPLTGEGSDPANWFATFEPRMTNNSDIYGISKNGNLVNGSTSPTASPIKSYKRTHRNQEIKELIVLQDKTLWFRSNGYGNWTRFGEGNNWEFIEGGLWCLGAINAAGECYMWGRATYTQELYELTLVTGFTGAERCYFGNGLDDAFVLDSAGLWVIGSNYYAELGTGDTAGRYAWTKQFNPEQPA